MPGTAAGEAPHSVDALVVAAGVAGAATLVLVHALVEVKVQLEPLRTAALVGAETVLTALVTPGVVITLVVVNAECARLVQFVSPGTDTPEASLRVLAGAWSWAESLLLHTLVHVQTPVAVLLVARPAHADEAAFSVDTVLLAVVLLSGALVNIPAGPPVSVQLKPGRTPTSEGAERVVALVLAGTGHGQALIEVLAGGPGEVWLVTSVTDAPVGPESVDTETVLTEVRH